MQCILGSRSRISELLSGNPILFTCEKLLSDMTSVLYFKKEDKIEQLTCALCWVCRALHQSPQPRHQRPLDHWPLIGPLRSRDLNTGL